MIPGMPAGMMDGNEEDTAAKLKRMIFITDAMRQDELDSDGMIFVSRVAMPEPHAACKATLVQLFRFRTLPFASRIRRGADGIQVAFDKAGNPIGLNRRAKRVARGSGTSIREVEELLAQARMMAGMARQAGGQNGW
jgi:signal recognition particle subunit SRP54